MNVQNFIPVIILFNVCYGGKTGSKTIRSWLDGDFVTASNPEGIRVIYRCISPKKSLSRSAMVSRSLKRRIFSTN